MDAKTTSGVIRALPRRFSKVKYLSEGGMGVVFRAFDDLLKREVAIKTVQRRGAKAAAYHIRLLREAKSLCSIRHQNVVRAYDFHQSDKFSYLVMEFLSGMPLNELKETCPLTSYETVRLIWTLADGLSAIHQAGLLHRDIKPANIVVKEDGQPAFIDFGLTIVSEKLDETRLTDTDCLVGTIGYLAPEVILGGEYSEKSDIYQLGVVFYELLTNTKLIDGEAFNKLLSGKSIDIKLPSEVAKTDKDLDSIVLAALEFDVTKRTASASKLAKQCEEWLKANVTSDFRPLDTLIVTQPTKSLVEGHSSARTSRKYSILFLFTAICLYFCLSSVSPKPTFKLIEIGPDWITFEANETSVFRVVSFESREKVFSGKPMSSAGKQMTCHGLHPSTKYTLFLKDCELATFETRELALKKPSVFVINSSFYLFAESNLRFTKLSILAGKNKRKGDIPKGSGRILLDGVMADKQGRYEWEIRCGRSSVAKGYTYAAKDFVPNLRKKRDLRHVGCWVGENILLGDQYWSLHLAETSLPNPKNSNNLLKTKWEHSLTKEQVTTRKTRWMLPYSREEVIYFGSHLVEDLLQLLLVKPGSSLFAHHKICLGQKTSIVHKPVIMNEYLLLQGVGQERPRWILLDPRQGKVVHILQGQKVESIPKSSKNPVISIDFGRNSAFDNGWGFISPPHLHKGKCYSLIAKAKTRGQLWARGHLYSVMCVEKDKLSSPEHHGSIDTWIGNHPVGHSKEMNTITFAGRMAIHYLHPNSQQLEQLFSIKGIQGVRKEGYLAAPSIELNGINYTIYISKAQSGLSSIDRVFNYRKLSLISWQKGQDARLLQPPILTTRSSTFQVPSVTNYKLINNRYLVGTTPIVLFVVDLLKQNFGSVFYAREVIEELHVSEKGIFYIGLRGQRISILPLELVLKSNPGRFSHN